MDTRSDYWGTSLVRSLWTDRARRIHAHVAAMGSSDAPLYQPNSNLSFFCYDDLSFFGVISICLSIVPHFIFGVGYRVKGAEGTALEASGTESTCDRRSARRESLVSPSSAGGVLSHDMDSSDMERLWELWCS